MLPLLALLLPACIENTLENKAEDPPFEDGDDTATVPTDSTDTTVATDDTGPPPAECPDDVPADDTVAQDVSCAGEPVPFSGKLVERWRVPLAGFATELSAARILDGNGDGVVDLSDPMQIVVDEAWDQVSVYDADGVRLSSEHAGAWRVWSTVADVDSSHLGAEVVAAGYELSGPAYVSLDGEAGVVRSIAIGERFVNYPWVTDLEGDGQYEVLQGPQVIDLATGASWLVGGGWMEDVTAPITADLDRDGAEEILISNWSGPAVVLRDTDGAELGTCVASTGPNYTASWAVGNLDGDDDGEFVAAGDGYVAICDTDGSPLASTDVGVTQPGQVGLAHLDDDPLPELVLQHQVGMVALDDDLSELWRWTAGTVWHPFALADLDQDGHHEVIVHGNGDLVVLSSAGAELARLAIHAPGSGAWRSQPLVVDLDADGLAEIVVAGYDLVVVEPPEGGWATPEADYPWPAGDHHPGDRTAAGGVVGSDPFWLDPERNVWHGLPVGTVDRPELTVEVEDVCVESCDGEAVVTVSVANPSLTDVWTEVELTLESVDRGEVLGTTAVAPLAAGERRHAVFRVLAASIAEGLRASVDAADRVRECDQRDNEDLYRDSPCP